MGSTTRRLGAALAVAVAAVACLYAALSYGRVKDVQQDG